MSTGAPLWVSFVGPAVSVVGFFVIYLFGLAQGKAQARYIKTAEVLTELRRLLLEIEMYVVDEGAVNKQKINELEFELVTYAETYGLWLRRPIRDRMVFVLRMFLRAYDQKYGRALRTHMALEALDESIDWTKIDVALRSLIIELTVETERVLGTGPPWWKPWMQNRKGHLKRYKTP